MTKDQHLSTALEQYMREAVAGTALSDPDFNTLALQIFAYQYEYNIPYRNFCNSQGSTPDNLSHWHGIPALPTDAFKNESFPPSTFPVENAHKTFLTSGTSSEVRGKHHFASTNIYDQSIISAWQTLQLPNPEHAVFLIAPPEQSPDSSLSHMMGVIAGQLAEQSTWIMSHSGSLDLEKMLSVADKGKPVALFGTALSFLHLFDSIKNPICLPPGSWAMETGGYKGTRHQLTKTELYEKFKTKLKLDPGSIINEYSMTELSSQFYTSSLRQPHRGPSWTRVRVIDPLTNADSKPGEPGHLVIYDLANLDSVMAICTQDLAIRNETNLEQEPSSFSLIGRDPSALPRGCSRSSDEILSP